MELGSGTHISGGWQLSGISLPLNALIRARGFLTSGGYTSAWFVETVLAPDQAPVIANDNSLGFQSGQFGFTLNVAAGQAVVIEASTDLATWAPLATNTYGTGSFYFSDGGTTNFTWRFYRARVQ